MAVNNTYGDEGITFGEHTVDVKCELLGGDIEGAVKNFLAKSEPGSAEVGVVVAAVRELKVDGNILNLRANRKTPRYWDDEREMSLMQFLTGYIVQHEKWLAKMFPNPFAAYLENEAAYVDPTKSPASEKKGRAA